MTLNLPDTLRTRGDEIAHFVGRMEGVAGVVGPELMPNPRRRLMPRPGRPLPTSCFP